VGLPSLDEIELWRGGGVARWVEAFPRTPASLASCKIMGVTDIAFIEGISSAQ